jgi:CRP-like cAMP-binding protein
VRLWLSGMLLAPKDAVSSNKLLSRLSSSDFRLLEPHLQPIDLPVRTQLEARNRRVGHVYFLDKGVASVVANGTHEIEVGMIGREGMTGLSVVLDGDSNNHAAHETYMQIGGSGHRVSAGDLRVAIASSTTLHHVLLRYAHVFLKQTTQTALANGCSKIEERLARWLLMAADRIDGNELRLTHEFLAIMLGVRRAGVTGALQVLERTGLVAHRRGVITILDREALEKGSNGTYKPLSDE